MNKLTRILALCALGSVSLTQGCSCSSNKNSTPNVIVEPPPPAGTVAVSGTAVKGLVKGATVNAYYLKSGGDPDTAVVLGTATTSDTGAYTITLPESSVGKTVIFRVTPAANGATKIKCDVSTGCDTGVAFGDDYSVPAGASFSLDALVSSLNAAKKANISTFSSIAYAVAKKNLVGLTDAAAILAAINKSNGEVKNLFGITEDNITDLEAIDLTDKAAVKKALDENKTLTLRLAALNSAIVQAAKNDNPNAKLEVALAKFIADFAALGLASNTSDRSLTDLTDILSSVKNILELVQSRADNQAAFNGLLTEVSSILDRVRNEPVDVFDRGTVDPVDTNVESERAYIFADTVRQLINDNSIVLATSVGNGKTVSSETDKLKAQLEAAAVVSGPDLNKVGEAVLWSGSAIVDAYNAYQANKLLQSYTAGTINVAIKTVTPNVNFTVKQAVVVDNVSVDVDVTSVAAISSSANDINAGTIQIAGMAKNTALSLTIKEGSVIEATKLAHASDVATVEGTHLKLLVDIAQIAKDIVNKISASGTLETKFDKLTQTGNQDSVQTGALMLNVGATFSNPTGDAFVLGFSVKGNSKGATFANIWQGLDLSADPTDKFTELSASLSFSANFNNQTKVAKYTLAADRVTANATRLSLDVAFGSNNIRFATEVKRQADQLHTVTITNHQKLVMTLKEAVDKTISGDIKGATGTKLADITQTKGTIKVSILQGGKFVSLVDLPE